MPGLVPPLRLNWPGRLLTRLLVKFDADCGYIESCVSTVCWKLLLRFELPSEDGLKAAAVLPLCTLE